MSAHTIPMPDEIDALIFDMIAAEAVRVLDDTSLEAKIRGPEMLQPPGPLQSSALLNWHVIRRKSP